MTPGPGIARTPLPAGFSSASTCCGVRRYRPDLGMILSDRDCVAAGVFTENQCKAASVVYSQKLLPSSHIRAIVTNSGQANAATGAQGWKDNWRMALGAANVAGCLPHQVLTASTGVIGVPLEIDKIESGFGDLPGRLSQSAESFALAILTTDLVPKTVTTTVQLGGGEVRLTGIAKGSGMIHPNMATMLGYLLTDAAIPLGLARPLIKEACDLSFNMISVDGETSTNDSVFLLANGASGVPLANEDDIALFRRALVAVSQCLAQAIARDGEGATKLVEVTVSGAPGAALARKAARGLVVSPLIKAAIHGEDPNWGRILARLGADEVPESALLALTLSIQGVALFAKGLPLEFDRPGLRGLLKSDSVRIGIDLNSGADEATAWGCDLSRKYVEINAEYST